MHSQDVPLKKIAEFDKNYKELSKDPAVQEMPVQSMITSPSANTVLSANEGVVKVKGIAWEVYGNFGLG